ncbi:MAG: hypothetical protein NZO16_00085 [Deltaproteobacteria bacterium]|nr:hypothetical protein [Deltaproteobacteria bacterium]
MESRELENIFKISRLNAIEASIKKAKVMAQEGDALTTNIYRNLAFKFADEIGVKLTKEQQ